MADFNRDSFFFTAFRKPFSFPYYAPDESSAFVTSHSVIIVSYILAVAWALMGLSALGTRAGKGRVFLKNLTTLVVGSSILLCIVGGNWQTSYEHDTNFNAEEFMITEKDTLSTVRLDIGTNWANITLRVKDLDNGETIAKFVHGITWDSTTDAERDYQKGLDEGYPRPVLKLAEYLSFDDGGLAHMRTFRKSGQHVYILLWVAFAFWIVANVLINMDVFKGSLLYLVIGVIQLITIIAYAAQQPANFEVRCNDNTPLRLYYGWNFWLTLVSGLMGVLISIGLCIFAYYYPEDANRLFDVEEEISVPFLDEAIRNELDEKPTPRVVKMFASIKRRSHAVSFREKDRKSRRSKQHQQHEAPIAEETELTGRNTDGGSSGEPSPKPTPVQRRHQFGDSTETLDLDVGMKRLSKMNDTLQIPGLNSDDDDSVNSVSGQDVSENASQIEGSDIDGNERAESPISAANEGAATEDKPVTNGDVKIDLSLEPEEGVPNTSPSLQVNDVAIDMGELSGKKDGSDEGERL